MNRISSSQGRGLAHAVGRASVRLALSALLVGTALPGQALENSTRLNAVNSTITGNQACTSLSKFYWEIGDKIGGAGHVWGGTGGGTGTAPTAGQQIPIYSAGKWVWGAYAYERLGGVVPVDSADDRFLTMESGHAANPLANACSLYTNIQSCRNSMEAYDSSKVDRYYYGPAHFQQQAITSFGMGAFNKTQLATEVHRLLGDDFVLTYNAPQMAGGAKSSVTDYAKFLRKILNAQLRIGSGLGSNAVCTFYDANTCPSAGYSPVNEAAGGLQEAWHYSLGHWVEDAPGIGDGAFSSPGAAGFYPWIDAGKTYYGILARNVVSTTSAANSVKCGRKIRAAWLTGNPQLE